MRLVIVILVSVIFIHSTIALADEISIMDKITKNIKDVCQSPDSKSKYWDVSVKAGGSTNKIVKLIGIGVTAEAIFNKKEWEGVQKVLRSDQAKDNINYRECVSKLTPLFINKFATAKSHQKNKQKILKSGDTKLTPHLAYEYTSNFAEIFFSDNDPSEKIKDLKSVLKIYNSSPNVITNVIIKTLYFVPEKSTDWFNTYDTDNINYIEIGELRQTILGTKEYLLIPLHEQIISSSKINLPAIYIFPYIGVPVGFEFSAQSVPSKHSQMFVDDSTVLKNNEFVVPNDGEIYNRGYNGARLKVLLSYQINNTTYTHLLVGGFFYTTYEKDNEFIPQPYVFDFINKAPLSKIQLNDDERYNLVRLTQEVIQAEKHGGYYKLLIKAKHNKKKTTYGGMPLLLNVDYAPSIAKSGVNYIKSNDYQKAYDAFTIALNIHPINKQLYLFRGQTLNRLKRYDEALADFTQYSKSNTENVDLLIDRGISFYYMGDRNNACRDWKDACRLNQCDNYLKLCKGKPEGAALDTRQK
jgi:hypothetical protein